MRDWFDALESRERIMVTVAGGFVVFAVFWFGLWLPLDRGQKDAAASVDLWQESLAELLPLKAQVQAGGNQPRVVAGLNQSLVVIIDTTLREHGLYSALQRSQPTSGNGIRVEFENVAFDDLVVWLGDVGSRYGMRVQSGSFSNNSSDNAGRVNSSITLER